jgi:hypothetical protein
MQSTLHELVEYLAIVHMAESLAPVQRDKCLEYWHHELARTWRFLMMHEQDYLAYLKQKSPIPEKAIAVTWLHSSEDLRTRIIICDRYMSYIQDKLDGLRMHRRYHFAMRA